MRLFATCLRAYEGREGYGGCTLEFNPLNSSQGSRQHPAQGSADNETGNVYRSEHGVSGTDQPVSFNRAAFANPRARIPPNQARLPPFHTTICGDRPSNDVNLLRPCPLRMFSLCFTQAFSSLRHERCLQTTAAHNSIFWSHQVCPDHDHISDKTRPPHSFLSCKSAHSGFHALWA